MPNKSSLLKLLFATFPPQTGDLQSMLEAYEIALDKHDERDIEDAVRRFIRGEVEGHNANFAPTAAKLGEAVRTSMIDRLDREKRFAKPKLPPPDVVKDDASRTRVKLMVDRFVADMADTMRTPESAADHLRKAQQWDRTNARFTPDMDDDAMRRRLMPFRAGDEDGDRDVA